MRKLLDFLLVVTILVMIISIPLGIWIDAFPFWKVIFTGVFTLFLLNFLSDTLKK